MPAVLLRVERDGLEIERMFVAERSVKAAALQREGIDKILDRGRAIPARPEQVASLGENLFFVECTRSSCARHGNQHMTF